MQVTDQAYDVVVLGAGAAGLMCAFQAAKRGQSVLLVDHMAKVGAKILISGGGRCNFTNLGTGPLNFVSENEHFSKSALSRYSPSDFCELLKEHKVPFHEKKLGQLFCDRSARDVVSVLESECKKHHVRFLLNAQVGLVARDLERELFTVTLNSEKVLATSLVVATGGLSIPKVGASGLGYKIARDFGLKVVETRPALDGFTFTAHSYQSLKDLAGLSVECILTAGGQSFRENILFTHKGLSGPAALQGSLYWTESSFIEINLFPDFKLKEALLNLKGSKTKETLLSFLTKKHPQRLAEVLCDYFLPSSELARVPLPQVSDQQLIEWALTLQAWKLKPSGTVGYSKAEVTRGGVSTDELSSKTMEAKKVQGLYFIGEVVDVTGWLGGYNFQWAWASAWAAAEAISSKT